MKSILAILMSFIFVVSSVALATPGAISNANMGANAQDDTGASNVQADSVTNVTVNDYNKTAAAEKAMAQFRIRNAADVRNAINESRQYFAQQIANISESKKAMHENQNRVRIAVGALLVMGGIDNGIGKNVSAIAREFNNSMMATFRSEERIQERNWLSRALFGGDRDAAMEIEQHVNQNTLRIQHLKDLLQNCDCTQELKDLIQEQIQEIEQEQERLRTLASGESASRGIFGWLLR